MSSNSLQRSLVKCSKLRVQGRWRGGFHASIVASFVRRRGVHVSGYEKVVEEEARPVIVPDEIINAKSDHYWGPCSKTGIFIPAVVDAANSGGTSEPCPGFLKDSSSEERVRFRLDEDLEIPNRG